MPRAGSMSAILKVALAEERERTTRLRLSLDETRIALAAISDEIEILRRHRDVWAERAKALATCPGSGACPGGACPLRAARGGRRQGSNPCRRSLRRGDRVPIAAYAKCCTRPLASR